MQLYVFNLAEELTGILSEDEFISCTHTQKLTGENFIEFTIPADSNNIKADSFKEGYYLGFYDLDNNFQMFEIITLEDDSSSENIMKTGYAEHVFYELRDNIIQDKRAYQTIAVLAVNDALSGSRWSVGDIEPFGTKSQNFYYESSLSALDKIRERWTYLDMDGRTAKGQFFYRLVLSGNKIVNRYVDFKHQVGEWRGKRFVAGKDLNSIKRKIDMSSLCTAAYGRGKGEEILKEDETDIIETGEKSFGRRMTFKEVEWVRNILGFSNDGFINLDKWTITSGSAASTTEQSFEGGSALKFFDDTVYSRIITTDFYEVIAGATIRADVRLYVPNNSAHGNTGAKSGVVEFLFFTSAQMWIKSDERIYSPDMAELNTWINVVLEVLAPANAAFIKIVLRTNYILEKGVIYFDSLKMGDPISKPLNQEFVEDIWAKALWGRAGGSINRMKIFEDTEETEARNLLVKTWQFVQDNNVPKVSYEANAKDLEQAEGYAHEAIRLGDIVYCLDENFRMPIEITARVMELKRDLFNAEDADFVLGNFFTDSADLALKQLQLERIVAARSDIWDRATVFEATKTGQRIRMVEKEGELQSLIKYEDDADPPNLIGYFSPEEFSYTKIRANEFIGQNVLMINTKELILYVDSYSGNDINSGSITAPFKTISRLNNQLSIPKYLMFQVQVFIQDSTPAGSTPFEEQAALSGITGGSKLTINIAANVKINGGISLNNCSTEISFVGLAGSLVNATSELYPVYISNCFNVLFVKMRLNAAEKSIYAATVYSSRVQFYECILERAGGSTYAAAVRASRGSLVQLLRCSGSNPNAYALAADEGSYISVHGTRPFAGYGAANPIPFSYYNAGSIISPSFQTDETFPAAAKSDWDIAAIPPPAPPPTTISQTMLPSDTRSWRYNYQLYRTDNTNIYQGSWGYGTHAGLWFFNNTFNFDTLLNKTLRSAKLYIHRDGIGGYAAAQQLHFYGHAHKTAGAAPVFSRDYGILASIKWGEEIAISLPQQFLNDVRYGVTKGLAIYNGASPYVILYGKGTYNTRIEWTYDT